MQAKRKIAVTVLIIHFLIQLHPIILLFLGLLDTNEAFLVLVVSYLVTTVFGFVNAGFIAFTDAKLLWFERTKLSKRISIIVSYLIGAVFFTVFYGFVFLMIFGLFFDAAERQQPMDSIFDGTGGDLLKQTLLINASLFMITEFVQTIRFIRAYDYAAHSITSAFTLGNKWSFQKPWFPFIWSMCFFAVFIFLCTAFAFIPAIIAFFIFDLGLSVFEIIRNKG